MLTLTRPDIIETVTTLADVPATKWDELALPHGLYSSHAWLSQQEADPSARAFYLLVRSDHGSLLAATPVYIVESEPNSFYHPGTVTGTSHDHPVALAGGRRGYQSTILLSPQVTGPLRLELVARLARSAEHLAREHGQNELWWMYTDTATMQALVAVGAVATPYLAQLDASIALPGHCFEDYLATLPSKRRVTIRREVRAFEESGQHIRTHRLSECWEQAGTLLAKVQQSHGHSAAPEVMQRLMRTQAEGMKDSGTVLGCYHGDVMTGFCLYYTFGGTIWARAVGFDYESLLGAGEYFTLAYYEPIRRAYADGSANRLHLGIEALKAKALRGACLEARWCARAGQDLPGEAERTRAENRDRLAELRSEAGQKEAAPEAEIFC